MKNVDNVAELIRQSNVLLSVLAKAQLREVMARELADAKKRKLYELTDGSRPVKELSQRVGMSPAAISRAWQHWEDCGMLVKVQGRYRRVFG
jgi:hypothetical protein